MLGTVRNIVEKDAKRLESLPIGWVVRFNFSEPNEEGMCSCTETLISSIRRPSMSAVKSAIENAGGTFIPSEYGY